MDVLSRLVPLAASFAAAAGFFPAASMVAQETLPQEVTPRDFSGVTGQSPFTRSLSLPNQMILTGVAELGSEEVAVLMNRETGESVMVSNKRNSMGWTLLEVAGSGGIEDSIVTVTDGNGQSFRVGFDEKAHGELMKQRSARLAEARKKKKEAEAQNGQKKPERPPTDEEKRKFAEAAKQKWGALNEAQRAEARRLIGEKFRANPGMSSRERGAVYMKILDHVRNQR